MPNLWQARYQIFLIILLKKFIKLITNFSKDFLPAEARGELNKIKKIEQQINRDDLNCKTGNKKKSKTYNFQQFKTIRSF